MTGWDLQNHRIVGDAGISPTLNGADKGGGRNPGGFVLAAAFMAGQGAKAGSIAYSERVAPTLKGAPSGLNQSPCAMITYSLDRAVFTQGQNAQYTMTVQEEQAQTLLARGPHAVTATYDRGHIVRRLTPQECAQLQGFGRDWCAGLETQEPTEEAIAFWSEVWETHRHAIGKASKPKTRSQIGKWLRQPHSDSAEYRLWGNGVALPCVCFVMAGIREVCGD